MLCVYPLLFVYFISISPLQGPSIASCTEEFVRGLQKEFPATIPTIFRTGDKLVSLKVQVDEEPDPCADPTRSEDSCALCASNLDTVKGEASALHATVISQEYISKRSQEISQQKAGEMKHDVSFQDCGKKVRSDGEMLPDPGGGICGCARAGGSCSKTGMSTVVDQDRELAKTVEHYLCYGCRITLRDLVSKTVHITCTAV